MRILAFSTMLFFTLLFQAVASDVTGKWKGNFAEGGDIVFDLKSDGAALTGTMTGGDGKSYPVAKGEVKDDKISFSVTTEYQGSPIVVLLNGTVAGATIKITMKTEDGSWSTDTVLTKQT